MCIASPPTPETSPAVADNNKDDEDLPPEESADDDDDDETTTLEFLAVVDDEETTPPAVESNNNNNETRSNPARLSASLEPFERGDVVCTPFGIGTMIQLLLEEGSGSYTIQLSFGKLYAPPEQTRKMMVIANHHNDNHHVHGQPRSKQQQQEAATMELNVAYEALEQMRKLNLELACQERGITKVDFSRCTACLLSSSSGASAKKSMMFRSSSYCKPKKGTPCLICNAPACKSHSCPDFYSQGITVCGDCKQLFKLDFVVDIMTCNDHEERRLRVGQMVDTYDRTLLLLKYSNQFIDELAETLERKTAVQNKVGLTSSSVGVMSGALGIAAAATIFTPAGPPLLIASLLFGGGASAVTTGSEAMNYYCKPNQLADRIIALHGMLEWIIKLTATLRDAMMLDHIRTDAYLEKQSLHKSLENSDDPLLVKHHSSIMAGVTVTRGAVAGLDAAVAASAATTATAAAAATETAAVSSIAAVSASGSNMITSATEASAMAGRNARFFSRAGTAASQAATFMQFAGGALAAATLLLEAKSMSHIISEIRAGNPCEKAQHLRQIALAATTTETAELDRECRAYLETLRLRERQLTQQEVVQLLLEVYNNNNAEETKMDTQDTALTKSSNDEEMAKPKKQSLLSRIRASMTAEKSAAASEAKKKMDSSSKGSSSSSSSDDNGGGSRMMAPLEEDEARSPASSPNRNRSPATTTTPPNRNRLQPATLFERICMAQQQQQEEEWQDSSVGRISHGDALAPQDDSLDLSTTAAGDDDELLLGVYRHHKKSGRRDRPVVVVDESVIGRLVA